MSKNALEDSKTLTQKRLDLHPSNPDNYLPFERAKEVTEDIRSALADGTLFKELVRPEIPKAMLKAVDDSFVNPLIEEGILPTNRINSSLAENLFSSISEAIENAINSEQFINQLGLEIAQKEVAREKEYPQRLGE